MAWANSSAGAALSCRMLLSLSAASRSYSFQDKRTRPITSQSKAARALKRLTRLRILLTATDNHDHLLPVLIMMDLAEATQGVILQPCGQALHVQNILPLVQVTDYFGQFRKIVQRSCFYLGFGKAILLLPPG